jgi:hypothetical protein
MLCAIGILGIFPFPFTFVLGKSASRPHSLRSAGLFGGLSDLYGRADFPEAREFNKLNNK